MYNRSGSPGALRTTWLSHSFSARVLPTGSRRPSEPGVSYTETLVSLCET